ncbi:MAG: ABC transporter permease [candidate division Zixibacteria bacterium]|nr:ABC transporter permease [candidate division Zixibacteria bacterium]
MEFKLFLREPMAAFFTLAFPLLLLFVFGSAFGNEPTQRYGGYGYVDIAVPAFSAMIIATSGIFGIGITLATYRETGILRRFHLTPLRPIAVLNAQTFVIFAMSGLGMILLAICGKLAYGLRSPENWLSVAAAFTLGSASFFALGFVVAGLVPTARTAHIVGMVLFYPMLFLSGAAFPRELLPEAVRRFAVILPLTHVVSLLRGTWAGDPWSSHLAEVGVLVAMIAAGIAISARTFRWE